MATTGASLKGKVALITGASSGIGAETARYFASLGCYVSITGRNVDNLKAVAEDCKAKGLSDDKVLMIQGELSNDDDIQRIVDRTLEHFGQIDVLVNNAGIVKPSTIETIAMQDFDDTFAINTRAPYLLLLKLAPHLIKTKGTVVNVSSVTGTRPFPGVLSYCMSKTALDALTRSASETLAINGVRINSVNPGVIKTEVHKRGGMDDEQYAKFVDRCSMTHALGRIGTPTEVAKAIAFLASDDSSFTTGETLTVDGGRHAMTMLRPKPETKA